MLTSKARPQPKPPKPPPSLPSVDKLVNSTKSNVAEAAKLYFRKREERENREAEIDIPDKKRRKAHERDDNDDKLSAVRGSIGDERKQQNMQKQDVQGFLNRMYLKQSPLSALASSRAVYPSMLFDLIQSKTNHMTPFRKHLPWLG